jgi:hypothetical protein
MAKIKKQYRIEEKLIDALKVLSPKGNMTETIETLIFREAIYKLSATELEKLFGDDYERLMLNYAVSPK